jgi:hypothetical protein
LKRISATKKLFSSRLIERNVAYFQLLEHNYLYGIPGGAFLASYAWAYSQGYPEVHQMAYLAASLCCVAAFAGMSRYEMSQLLSCQGMDYYHHDYTHVQECFCH